MTDRHNRTVRKGAKVKSPIKEDSVFLQNKDLFSKFELELRSPDKILQHEGFDYYDKMLDTDAHVYSIITTRKMGAGSFPYKLTPKNQSTEAIEQMTFIQYLLNQIPIENHFFDILDAIPKGFSIHEIVSRPTDENDDFQDKILINRLIFHPQQHFTFKVKKKTGYDLYFKPADFSEEKKLPMENFLHANFDSNSPYGKPLLEKLYWYYWFKKETGFKFWAIFLEKFGGPTAIMKYPSGDTSTKLQTAANEALEDLQNSSGISIPDSFTLDFAKVSQGDISYQNMIDACNAEMSKAALGATQTVEEGRRGSYALSRTHTDVRAEYKLHDVRILRKAIQPQIIDRYTKLNFSNPLPPKIDFIIPANNTVLDKPDPDHKGSIRDDSLNLKLIELVDHMVALKYGGPGSGDFQHPGRSPDVGGSGPAGGDRPASRDKRARGGLSRRGGQTGGRRGSDVSAKDTPTDTKTGKTSKSDSAASDLGLTLKSILDIGANALALGPGLAAKEFIKRAKGTVIGGKLRDLIGDTSLPIETLTTLKLIQSLGLAIAPDLISPIQNIIDDINNPAKVEAGFNTLKRKVIAVIPNAKRKRYEDNLKARKLEFEAGIKSKKEAFEGGIKERKETFEKDIKKKEKAFLKPKDTKEDKARREKFLPKKKKKKNGPKDIPPTAEFSTIKTGLNEFLKEMKKVTAPVNSKLQKERSLLVSPLVAKGALALTKKLRDISVEDLPTERVGDTELSKEFDSLANRTDLPPEIAEALAIIKKLDLTHILSPNNLIENLLREIINMFTGG